jgi:hypothetical protein
MPNPARAGAFLIHGSASESSFSLREKARMRVLLEIVEKVTALRTQTHE